MPGQEGASARGGLPRPPRSTPIDQPGWYRTTQSGWQRVDDIDAEHEVATGAGYDLVRVDITPVEEPGLW